MCVSDVLERYHRELLIFLTRQVNDRDAAADLAQESYARVLAVQESGQAVRDARALLYRTARNLVIDRHRRAEVRRHDDLDALPEAEHPPRSATSATRRGAGIAAGRSRLRGRH